MTSGLQTKKAAIARGASSGFTLLELLISFALLGVIVAIMASALRLGFRTVASGEGKVDAIERFRSSVGIIDAQIQSLCPLTFDDQGERKLMFSGGRASLEFPTNYSIWGGEKGYVIVRYAVEADTSGKRIITVTEHLVGTETTRTARLFNPIDDIYFEYFYKGPTDEKGSWVDDWTETKTTPEKIRLHLVDGSQEITWIIPARTVGSVTQQPAGQQPPRDTIQKLFGGGKR